MQGVPGGDASLADFSRPVIGRRVIELRYGRDATRARPEGTDEADTLPHAAYPPDVMNIPAVKLQIVQWILQGTEWVLEDVLSESPATTLLASLLSNPVRLLNMLRAEHRARTFYIRPSAAEYQEGWRALNASDRLRGALVLVEEESFKHLERPSLSRLARTPSGLELQNILRSQSRGKTCQTEGTL